MKYYEEEQGQTAEEVVERRDNSSATHSDHTLRPQSEVWFLILLDSLCRKGNSSRAPFACATGESAARAVKSRVEEAKESLQAEAGGLVGSVGRQGKQRKNALSGRRD